MATVKRRVSDRRFSGPMTDRVRHARRLAGMSQADLARQVGVGPSAVAQWELPSGTSPTVEHLAHIAKTCGVAFEWLATGRGVIRAGGEETPAVESSEFARDLTEERLLFAFRRIASKKRESLVRWLEEFI